MIASRRRKVEREPTIALINIVFLILIFFMVAGTLSEAPQAAFDLVTSDRLETASAGEALVISASGAISHEGRAYADPRSLFASRPELRAEIRILPARELPAARLLEIMRALQDAGAQRVLLVAERV